MPGICDQQVPGEYGAIMNSISDSPRDFNNKSFIIPTADELLRAECLLCAKPDVSRLYIRILASAIAARRGGYSVDEWLHSFDKDFGFNYMILGCWGLSPWELPPDATTTAPGEIGTLTIKDLAKRLGCSTRSIERSVEAGQLPEPIKLGRRRVWCITMITRHLERRAAIAEKQATHKLSKYDAR